MILTQLFLRYPAPVDELGAKRVQLADVIEHCPGRVIIGREQGRCPVTQPQCQSLGFLVTTKNLLINSRSIGSAAAMSCSFASPIVGSP